jgi:hypothetical protein
MTGRTIASHDPDLAQTITDMAAACHRLALAEERIHLAHRADNAPQLVPHAVAHAGAIRDTIATRASRLNVKPFGLRLIIEEHERLRIKQGRRRWNSSSARSKPRPISSPGARRLTKPTNTKPSSMPGDRARWLTPASTPSNI